MEKNQKNYVGAENETENKKVKAGVFGAGRGSGLMHYCLASSDAELVAICDKR